MIQNAHTASIEMLVCPTPTGSYGLLSIAEGEPLLDTRNRRRLAVLRADLQNHLFLRCKIRKALLPKSLLNRRKVVRQSQDRIESHLRYSEVDRGFFNGVPIIGSGQPGRFYTLVYDYRQICFVM